jgi:hypothetical protein
MKRRPRPFLARYSDRKGVVWKHGSATTVANSIKAAVWTLVEKKESGWVVVFDRRGRVEARIRARRGQLEVIL